MKPFVLSANARNVAAIVYRPETFVVGKRGRYNCVRSVGIFEIRTSAGIDTSHRVIRFLSHSVQRVVDYSIRSFRTNIERAVSFFTDQFGRERDYERADVRTGDQGLGQDVELSRGKRQTGYGRQQTGQTGPSAPAGRRRFFRRMENKHIP